MSELDLPDSIPRIRFWSNENVATYVYLDTINEEKLIFGKASVGIFKFFSIRTFFLMQRNINNCDIYMYLFFVYPSFLMGGAFR